MWDMDMAKRVLESARKALEERSKLGFTDNILQATAEYLDYALTTVEWHEKAAREKVYKKTEE